MNLVQKGRTSLSICALTYSPCAPAQPAPQLSTIPSSASSCHACPSPNRIQHSTGTPGTSRRTRTCASCAQSFCIFKLLHIDSLSLLLVPCTQPDCCSLSDKPASNWQGFLTKFRGAMQTSSQQLCRNASHNRTGQGGAPCFLTHGLTYQAQRAGAAVQRPGIGLALRCTVAWIWLTWCADIKQTALLWRLFFHTKSRHHAHAPFTPL